MNNESILTSVKKVLGIEPEVEAFDDALVMHINTALSVLHQLGVGPKGGLYITDKNTSWNELIGGDNRLSMVKTYIQIKVRLIFDPPSSSSVLDAMERSLKETEWRILAVTDYGMGEETSQECVDEIARAEIAEHKNDTDIHHTVGDIEKMITDVTTIHATL